MKQIRKILALALALMLACAAGGALAEAFSARQIAYCNEYVTLRESPSSSSRALDQVWLGEVVMASPYNSEFSYCCYNGRYGYIKSQYLSSNVQPYSDGRFRVANCNSYISLRSMPSTSAPVLAKVPLGAEFDQICYADGPYNPDAFAYVRYNGQYGWVLWRYLQYISASESQAFSARQIYNCNEYVTLRAEPNASSRALAQVWYGDVVMASPYNSEFSYCCFNGRYGYIKSQYLSPNVQPYSDGRFRVANCNSYISLRSMPSTSASVLAKVPLGAEFEEICYADGGYDPNAFAYVRYNGQYGWVLWQYLEYISVPGGQ